MNRVEIPKCLDLPGEPGIDRCKLNELKEESLKQWVKMNWIKKTDDVYVKPGSRYSTTGKLKGSHDDEPTTKELIFQAFNNLT